MSKWTKTQNRVNVLLSRELTFVCFTCFCFLHVKCYYCSGSYLLVCCLSHIQDLASQREYSITIPTNDSQSRNGQRLCRVPLSEDKCAFRGVFAT